MIDFKDVEKNYAGTAVLDKVTFRINPGERVGVVGPNGAGKSTIFNMITGAINPDSGQVLLPKNMRIGYMKQQLPTGSGDRTLLDFTADAIPELKEISSKLKEIEKALHENPDNEAKDDLLKRHGEYQTQYEHLGAYKLRSEAEAALSNLGFPVERHSELLKSFSGGWQMRAMLARVLISNPDILLLDEPSNYLDIPAVEWLCKFLKSYAGTLLLISHDRFLLRKLTSITLEVNAGQVNRYPGDYDYYRTARDSRLAALAAAKRNNDRKKDHLERVIDRFRAKSSKAAQAKSWQKALDRIEDISLPDDLAYHGEIRFPEAPPCGVEAARIENLTFGYTQEQLIFDDVDLRIDKGDKLAFVGYNGMGKTTLLKLLVGRLKPLGGRIVTGHNVIIGYQAQEFSEILVPEQTAYDVVRGALKPGSSANQVMNVLGAFGFSGEAASKTCKVLSGGEKIRLSFARIFVNPPNLLVLDEPTTHLDVAARELLQQALQDYTGTVCLVSHDIDFVRAVATSIVAMERPKIRKYFGNYDYYLEKSAELVAGSNSSAGKQVKDSASDSKERRRERAKFRAALFEEKNLLEKKVKKIEHDLEKLEVRQAELHDQLADPNAKINFQLANRELFDVQSKIADQTAAWESAALALEELIKKSQSPD